MAMMDGSDVVRIAEALVLILAGFEPPGEQEIADARVETATNLRDLGFDPVAAYDLADRTNAATVKLASAGKATREAAEAVVAVGREVVERFEAMERRRQ